MVNYCEVAAAKIGKESFINDTENYKIADETRYARFNSKGCSDLLIEEYIEALVKFESEPQEKTSYPSQITQCDRTYDETSRTLHSRSSSPSYLNYDMFSGKVSVESGDLKTREYNSISSMDKDKFFEMCSLGNSGSGREACPYYIECVSQVIHNKSGKKGKLEFLTFDDAAIAIRKQSIESGQLKASKVEHNGRSMRVKNFVNACDSVSSTYNGVVVGATIFQHVPEIPDFKTAMVLGETAVKGYGVCRCVLANYTELHESMSIGYCVGDKMVDCNSSNGGAFCGLKLKKG